MKCENSMVGKINCLRFLKTGFKICSRPVKFRLIKPSFQFRTMRCSSQVLDQTHDFSHKNSFSDMSLYSVNSMMSEFCKIGDLTSARQLFDRMTQRDTISWNSMMAGYNQNDQPNQVLQLVSNMQHHDLYPNQTTISTALSACAKLRTLNQGIPPHGML